MSKTRKAWTVYIVLRLLFFAVPFGLMYAAGMRVWLAAIFAALIGVALSVLLLSKQRAVASESIYDWRNRDHGKADALVEDDAVDAVTTEADTTTASTPEADSTDADATQASAPETATTDAAHTDDPQGSDRPIS